VLGVVRTWGKRLRFQFTRAAVSHRLSWGMGNATMTTSGFGFGARLIRQDRKFKTGFGTLPLEDFLYCVPRNILHFQFAKFAYRMRACVVECAGDRV
jgi:hypothetical protein